MRQPSGFARTRTWRALSLVWGVDPILIDDLRDELEATKNLLSNAKFQRLENAGQRGIGRTGLSLALVGEIVEAHGGGRVAVSSREGEGSTFSFVVTSVTADMLPEMEGSQSRAEEGIER